MVVAEEQLAPEEIKEGLRPDGPWLVDLLVDSREEAKSGFNVVGVVVKNENTRIEKRFSLQEMLGPEGVVLHQVGDHKALSLKLATDSKTKKLALDPEGSAGVHLTYLKNGAFGSTDTCKLRLSRTADQSLWALECPPQGKVSKKNKDKKPSSSEAPVVPVVLIKMPHNYSTFAGQNVGIERLNFVSAVDTFELVASMNHRLFSQGDLAGLISSVTNRWDKVHIDTQTQVAVPVSGGAKALPAQGDVDPLEAVPAR